MIRSEEFRFSGNAIRLDAAVSARYPATKRSLVKDAIGRGEITVNGKKAAKGMKLKGGELIGIVSLAEESDCTVVADGTPPEPVYEDDCLLAFDKPAGIAVQPLTNREKGTLMNGVVNRYPECRLVGDNPLMAGALHRIDAGTSGLVLVARNDRAFDLIRRQFSAHSVEKKYLALVEGPVDREGTLENDLMHDPSLPFCKMVDSREWKKRHGDGGGRRTFRAVTSYRPVATTVEENETRTLLEITIFTGVTHQIRAQLALNRMHIINDRLYGAFAVENMCGHLLHSLSAKFVHPASGEVTTISTEWPRWARF